MKKTRIIGVIFALVLSISAFAVFASASNNAEIEASVGNTDVYAGKYDVPEVVIKPPVDYINNSSELKDAAEVVFSSGKVSGYVILHNSAGGFANDLSNLFYKNGKSSLDMYKDSEKAETDKEILVGLTNREISSALAEAVDVAYENGKNYAWGYKVEGGKLALFAANNASYNFLLEEVTALFTSDGLTLKEGLYVVRYKNYAEHKAEEEALAEAEKIQAALDRYNKVMAALDAYKGSDIFRTDSNGVVQEGAEIMPSDAYPDPEQYPQYGEHPRVYVNSETLPRLRELFNDPPEELAHLVTRVKEYADNTFDGTFPEISGKTYTYNASLFKYMEAKAFMYLMTGDELYGYEAILCAKNCILTMVYTEEIFKDTYRGANHAMTVITEIYDWCYDLMTEEDKTQIIDGSRFYLLNTLEFTYPPSNMGYISGHGMSYQFLHTYLGFSLAISDERPDWWDFVGGRFYSQYCLGINYCVQNGYYSQGTTCYAPGKLYNIYISSWIVESATGEYPYNHGLRDVPYFMLSQLMPNNRYFEYGDTPTTGYGASVDTAWMIISVGMYNDPTVYAAAKKFSNGFNNISENDFGSRISAPMALVFLAGCAGSTESFAENLPLIEYTGTPSGITVAREAWNDSNAATVFMKVGELNMANHDHRDSGTFQIYYKGLLAPANAGQYNVYASEHWKYYHQATISDNGLLVFDPDLYEEPELERMKDESGNDMTDKYGNPMYKVLNPQKAFYTGSQRAIGEASNFDVLLSNTHNFGTIVGHAEGYNQDASVKYAYLAGDITNAYNSTTASYVGRSMLTVFTGDPDFPMYFFVYDNVTPIPGDDDVEMKFLLHSVTEPTVDGSRVIIENGDGQLVLLNTTGNEIEAIGGSGKKYWVNGINIYEDTYKNGLSAGSKQNNDDAGKLWGRTEVTSPVGETGNTMLNVMYVADKGEREMLSASSYKANGYTGSVIGNVAVFFADTSVEFATSAATVSADGDGLLDYYFMGLDVGTWKIYLGEGDEKQLLGTTYSSNETHMITFKAPAGTITIEPGEDIKPSNSGKIVYQNVTTDIKEPKYYSYDGITKLPETAVNDNNKFLGWYLDPGFTQPIKEIDGSLYQGTIIVYAKFKLMYANEDYSWVKDNPKDSKTFSYGSISYSGVEDPAVNYKTGYEAGKCFVVWTGSTGGPVISINSSNNSIQTSLSTKFTYTFSLAKNGSDPVLNTSARIVSTPGKPNNTLDLFSTYGGYLNVVGQKIELTNEFFTFSIVLDFEEGTKTAYTEFGEKIGSIEMPMLENATNGMEVKKILASNILNWRNNGGGKIRIGKIIIEDGGFITDPDSCLHRDVNDDNICDRCKSEFSDGCEHYDDDDDLKCDKCGDAFDDGCSHRDANDDGKCDKCEASFDDGCEICRDVNDDGKCDRCAKSFSDGCDNHVDMDDDLKCDIPGCDKDWDDGCNHFDKDDDKKCDKCAADFEDGCEICRDADDDLKCDKCGTDFNDGEELPDGQWRINYVLGGGILPVSAPTIHITGAATKLPLKATLDGKIFGGWYLDEAFTTPIEVIDAEHAAPITVYAKWNSYIVRDDFSWTENSPVDYSGKAFSQNGVTYPKDTAYKSFFEDGKGYLVWQTHGASVGPVASGSPFKTDSDTVTYSFSLGAYEGWDLMKTEFRFVGANPGTNKVLFSIFTTSKDGTLTLLGKHTVKLLTDEMYSFSITVDYANETLTAYTLDGALITSAKLPAAPQGENFDTWDEWKNNFTGLMNWRNSNGEGVSGAIKIGYFAVSEGGVFVDPDTCAHVDADDDLSCDKCKSEFDDGCTHIDVNDDEKCDKCQENFTDGCDIHRDADDNGICDNEGCGKEYDDGEEIPEGAYRITYVLPEGVMIPSTAPEWHVKGQRTVLPAAFDRTGYIFLGWYLDEACTQPVDYIDKNHEGDLTVYPKWNKIIIEEDYAWTEHSPEEKSEFSKNGISYNKGTDSNYKFEYSDGKGYVIWSAAQGPVIVGSAPIGDIKSGKITFTLSFAKDGENPTLNTSYRIIGRAPDTTSNTELHSMFGISAGKLNLCGKSIELTNEFYTFSITIDFINGMKTAYTPDGEVIGTASLGNAPAVGEVDTWEEWSNNLAYPFNFRSGNSSGGYQSIKIGYIGMYEGGFGDKYVQNIPSELPDGAYRINYQLGGAILPAGAPDRFIAGVATPLPTDLICTNPNSIFVGWYSDATFTTPITEVPADAPNTDFTVYAKVVESIYSVDVKYVDDATTGTVVANRYCVHEGGDSDSDGICNTCGFCAGHVDVHTVTDGEISAENVKDGLCDTCGYKIVKCSTHSDVHTIDGAGRMITENVADKYCDICGRCPTTGNTYDSGKIGNAMYLQDCDQPYGYGKIIDNGEDDYLHVEGNYSGTLIQHIGLPEVKSALANAEAKAITFRMVYGCYGDSVINTTSRMIFRKADDSGNAAITLIQLAPNSDNSGMVLKSKSSKTITTVEYGTLIDVSFVVDFDSSTISYYLADSTEAILIENFEHDYTRGLGMINHRLSGTGTVDISATEIYIGDKYN